MFGRFAVSILAMLGTGGAQSVTPPPLAKIPDADANFHYTTQALAAACQGKDGWTDPAPPAHIHGNTWIVGTCGITALLITTPHGHILIDAGMPAAAPLVAANIEKLGFALKDVRWIVGGHEHFDHAGGIGELKRLTGARVAGIAPWARVMGSGQPDKRDPQYKLLIKEPLPPVFIDRVLRDHDTIKIGGTVITAHATPVHSPGSTSWTWQSCEGSACTTITYADSASTISADGYRFSQHPDRIAAIAQGIKSMAALPCGILLTPHPSSSDQMERMAAGLKSDARACKAYASAAAARFATRQATESAAK